MESLIKQSMQLIHEGRPFAMATIISHQGSTPRTSGSGMLVKEDKTIYGTIGGGLVEARVIDACARMMDLPCPEEKEHWDHQSSIMDFTLDQEKKQSLDMICGGSLSVWIQCFAPPFSPALVKTYQVLADLEARGEKAVIVTRISDRGRSDTCLISGKEKITGPDILPRPLAKAITEQKFPRSVPAREIIGLEQYIIEPLSPPDILFIFGGGHVGLMLARMAGFTDFNVAVIDDRREFANAVRFPHADAIHVIENFSSAFKNLCITKDSYIVILTRGHLHDQTVLEQALETDAGYIGMIGSRPKRDRIYANLIKKGVDPSVIDRVHSPIGIPVLAETPAEIAVSILGEVIMVRARNRKQNGKQNRSGLF